MPKKESGNRSEVVENRTLLPLVIARHVDAIPIRIACELIRQRAIALALLCRHVPPLRECRSAEADRARQIAVGVEEKSGEARLVKSRRPAVIVDEENVGEMSRLVEAVPHWRDDRVECPLQHECDPESNYKPAHSPQCRTGR